MVLKCKAVGEPPHGGFAALGAPRYAACVEPQWFPPRFDLAHAAVRPASATTHGSSERQSRSVFHPGRLCCLRGAGKKNAGQVIRLS